MMSIKKGEIYEGMVETVQFPNKGIVPVGDQKVIVKNTIPGQKVRFQVNKVRKGKAEARLTDVLEKAPNEVDAPCPHFGVCGGCTWQNLSYKDQLALKEKQVRDLLKDFCPDEAFEGIKASPQPFAYRNKMEFSFGDEVKDGPLALGMHKRGSFYDIVTVDRCQIVDEDFRQILLCVLEYARLQGWSFYHKLRHEGFLRHLLVRRAVHTGEILIDLVTTTEQICDIQFEKLVEALLKLPLRGKIAGILHTANDSLADVIHNDSTQILWGQDFFYEVLLGLRFCITPFSFFQTNSLGAEVLYETVRSYVGDVDGKVVYDLYSGTGTIAQVLAPVAKQVVGVEIVPEAVEAAKQNARDNELTNCTFIAGDVLKVLDELTQKPDAIILDPPRDGIHPKALEKIIGYGLEQMVYISCKPTSLARDLEVLTARGYRVERACCVDMFPFTANVETCALLTRTREAKFEF